MLKAADIERIVAAEGFDLCGITEAVHISEGEERFRRWLSSGYGGDLEYLYRNQELRFNASKIVEGGRSVIVCGVNYRADSSLNADAVREGVGIASYALMRDYHTTIRKMLKRVLRGICELYPHTSGRVFVDSAPLLEKALAVNAGLGWIGRQSLLVTKEYGSFVLLGEIVLDQSVDRYNEQKVDDRCGECRRCVDSCPVGAINSDRTIDARLCISSRTVEGQSGGDGELAGWIFGCDVCQSCCPHNQKSAVATHPSMQGRITPPTPQEWLSMTSAEFDAMAQGTPLRRSSLERIQHFVRVNQRDKK